MSVRDEIIIEKKNYPKKRRQSIIVVDDITLRLALVHRRPFIFFPIVRLHFFLSFEFIEALDKVIVARLPNECNFFFIQIDYQRISSIP